MEELLFGEKSEVALNQIQAVAEQVGNLLFG